MTIFVILGINPYKHLVKSIELESKKYQYYDVGSFGPKYGKINLLIITLCDMSIDL